MSVFYQLLTVNKISQLSTLDYKEPPKTPGLNSFKPLCKVFPKPAARFNKELQKGVTINESEIATLSKKTPIELQDTEKSKIEEPKRKDRKGRIIDKVKKIHHVTFRDTIMNKAVADIKEVESYKVYNNLGEEIQSKCSCLAL